MSTPFPPARSRVLVLSGGGPLGIAWQSGLAAGLADSGILLADADRILGTSAGSIVGARLASGADPHGVLSVLNRLESAYGSGPQALDLESLFAAMADATTDASPEEGRRSIGRLAAKATTPVTEQQMVDALSFLDEHEWPTGYACTAVDVDTGQFQVWEATSGVPLSRAVASSCAAPLSFPVITINGHGYMDGGVRSNLNADHVDGHDCVIAVSCLPLQGSTGHAPLDPMIATMAATVSNELTGLRDAGSLVEVVQPREEFLRISRDGIGLGDFSRSAEAFAAGQRQAPRELRRIRDAWGSRPVREHVGHGPAPSSTAAPGEGR